MQVYKYESNGLKVKTLPTEYVGIAGLIAIFKFEVTLPNGDIRVDKLDTRDEYSSKIISYISGANNIAEKYYEVIS